MKQNKVLVLGGGGREHALCYQLSKSAYVDEIFCVPANAGIAQENSKIKSVHFDMLHGQTVLEFCQDYQIDLVVLGSEAPAAAGIADILHNHHIKVFGCSQQAAMLEASKTFTKKLCETLNVPTAKCVYVDTVNQGIEALSQFQPPYVIKADGLAAGKGVVIAHTFQEAQQAIEDMLAGSFGTASNRLVIEEFLEGEEASFFVLSDGIHSVPFGTAQDHKRAFDNDTGPNTGGMGAYSPASIMTEMLQEETIKNIIQPIIKQMHAQGTPFIGVLYAGLMLTKQGVKLIEFNVRFGDPECQVLMMRLQSDLFLILNAVATQSLNELPKIEWKNGYAVTIVMASEGYPNQVIAKGNPIILPKIDDDTIKIFHAGTALNADNQFIANGGRVLNVTAFADTIQQATQKAYCVIDEIEWKQSFYRKDIGYQEIKRVIAV